MQVAVLAQGVGRAVHVRVSEGRRGEKEEDVGQETREATKGKRGANISLAQERSCCRRRDVYSCASLPPLPPSLLIPSENILQLGRRPQFDKFTKLEQRVALLPLLTLELLCVRMK